MKKQTLKLLAIAMSVFMILSALAIPAFAADDEPAPFVPTPVETDATYDEWDGTFDTTPFDGITDKSLDRSNEDPIIIDTAAKLAGLAKATNDAALSNIGAGKTGAFPNQKFYITKNIDLKCLDFPVIGESYKGAQFSGIIEGRLNDTEGAAITIANLSIPKAYANSNEPHCGFIGTLRGGGVKNLTFLNASVGNAQNNGGVSIVAGYVSKTIQCFEGITIIDSTLTTGTNDSGFLMACCKTDHSLMMKDCAVINSTVITNSAKRQGALVGHYQGNGTTTYDYGFENCYISGSLTNTQAERVTGFVATFSGNAKLIFRNCHYNATRLTEEESKEFADVQAVLVGEVKTAGIQLVVDGLLVTGYHDVLTEDGKMPLLNFVPMCPVTVDAKNIYSTVPLIGFAYNLSEADDEIAYTQVTETEITGAAAATTLAGFDFENAWATRDGKIATLKVAVADEYDATPSVTPPVGGGDDTDPPVGGGDDTDPPVGGDDTTPPVGGDDTDPPIGGGDDTDPPVGGDDTDDKKDDHKKEHVGGCGSVVSATCLVTLLTVGMGVTVIRKKKECFFVESPIQFIKPMWEVTSVTALFRCLQKNRSFFLGSGFVFFNNYCRK